MSVTNRVNRDATLHRWVEGGRDDASGDYKDPSFTSVPCKVDVQQNAAQELRDGRMVTVSTWTAFFRPDLALTANDEITVPGLGRFAFDGEPWRVTSPRTGAASHWFARLRKVS